MKQACALALLLLVPLECAAAGEYRTAEVEFLKVTYDSEWGPRLAPGYLPVRFDITNLGDARVIEIVGEGTRWSTAMWTSGSGMSAARMGAPTQVRIRQTVRMAHGDRIRFTVPAPVLADSENFSFEIQQDGRTLERFSYTGVQSRIPAANASALIVADRSTPFGRKAAEWPRHAAAIGPTAFLTASPGPTATGARSRPLPAVDFLLEPARLPVNWLGYTSLRAVVIGAAEWAQLDDAQKGALLAWAGSGGNLIFADADSAAPAAGPYLFGRVHRVDTAAIDAAGLSSVLDDADKLQDADWALPANRAPGWATVAARGFRLPIPGVAGVPARAYLSILIAFSLLIGPVNYWILRRRGRQVLFVLTAPVISAIFIVLLGGYVVAGEGFRVSGRVATLTMLDQASRQAVTRGAASLYAAGMTPGGGLRFPRDAAVYAIGVDGFDRDAQLLDLTDDQQFASGVIHARAPTNFDEVLIRPARERLTFAGDSRGLTVTNGLGATMEKLMVRRGGKTYALEATLAPGATGTLKEGALNRAAFAPMDLPMSAMYFRLFDRQPEGSYLAVLGRSPFWEPGTPNVVERGSIHVVFGWPDGRP